MDLQQEYREELQKVQDRDFTHNWVSSSAFIFYLSVASIIAFSFGTCSRLFAERYENSTPQKVNVPENTLYTTKYK